MCRMRRADLRNVMVHAAAVLLFAVPAYAGELRVLLEGETGVRNDGNLRQVGRQVGSLEGEADPEAQDVGRAGLHLLLSYNARQRFDLALGYSPSYERSFDDSSLAGATHRLDLGLRSTLTRRLALDVRERLLSSPGLDLYTPAAAPESIAVTQRGRQLSHSLDIGLHNELSRRSTLSVGLSNSVRRFETGDLADAQSVGASLGGAFHFDRERELGITAGAERFSWERGREANVRTAQVSYAQPIGRFVHMRLEAGSFYVEQRQPGGGVDPAAEEAFTASKTGWRGGLQLSQQLRLFRWDVGYRHDVDPGYGVARAVEADNAFLGASTSIDRRFTIGVDANGSRQRDLNASASEPLTELAAGTLRMTWGFTPTLRLTGGYSRVWQRSRVQLFDDLSFNRYFLGLAFRIYQTGERPHAPEELGREGAQTDANAEPDVP
jgi:hypothetical protein